MFHIKTDIRQYKCESEQKVERLIRNWVIRPTDLIYDAQKDSWKSIGEHAAFHPIFVMLEKEEAGEPDTLVTQAPSEIAAEFEVLPGSELGDAPSDADQTLTFDKHSTGDDTSSDKDSDEDEVAEYPRPPEAPDGVEGLIRDSDEITMMTDRTLDMLRDDNGDDAPNKETAAADTHTPSAPESDAHVAKRAPQEPANRGRHGLPEDVFLTDEIFREDIHASIRDDLKDLDDDANETAEIDEDEVTQLVERDSFFNTQEQEDAKESVAEEEEEEDATLEEVSSARVDLADDIEGDAPPESGQGDAESDDDEKARWRITSSEDEPELPEQDDKRAFAEDESHANEADLEAFDDYQAMDDAELDAMLNEAAALVGIGEREGDSLENDSLEDEDGDADPEDIEEILDVEDLDEDKDEERDARDRANTPVGPPPDSKPDISGGYALPLPLDVSPSAEALKRGLIHSRLSREVKDATFPSPKPKVIGELATREFDLAPPPPPELPPVDHSLRLVIGIVIFVALALFGAIKFFG